MASFSLPTVLAAAAFSLVVGDLASGPAVSKTSTDGETIERTLTIRFDSEHGLRIERASPSEALEGANEDDKVFVIEASSLRQDVDCIVEAALANLGVDRA